VTITFSRSGGIAAMPGQRVSATASTTARGGTVSAEGYSRAMTSDEAARLGVDVLQSIAETQAVRGQHSAARDAFTYQFSIVDDEGVTTTLSATDGVQLPPAVEHLVAWARQEIARIVSARM
jgi:hypothetical protein